MQKEKPVALVCHKHGMAKLEGEEWTYSGLRLIRAHVFDVTMKEEPCPECLEEPRLTREPQPITFDGKTWAR